ncbi:hypothetical protein EJB05_03180, partial [Eragrostis curvula]
EASRSPTVVFSISGGQSHIQQRKMAEPLVSSSTGVMNSLLAKLSSLIEGEYEILEGTKRDISFLRTELSSMNALLEKLATSEKLDSQVQVWRDNIRELSYDIEDCIDIFKHKLSHGDAKAGFVKKITAKIQKLWSRYQMANQIQELKARVVEESERHLRYKYDEPAVNAHKVEIDPRLPALYVEAEKLVGTGGPMKKVMNWLLEHDSSNQLKVVSIVGFGGFGKTTLANQVYQKMNGQFDCTAFVPVSRNPILKKVLLNLLKELRGDTDVSCDERQIINELRAFLQDKRYLIIVDDVWSTTAWDFIKSALPENNLRSRIITTTRHSDVAESCCSYTEGYIHYMQPLSDQDSQKLFFKRVFHSQGPCPPHLEEVSQEIIQKCHGMPLAINTIASLLANKSGKREQWEQEIMNKCSHIRSLIRFRVVDKEAPHLPVFHSLRVLVLRCRCRSLGNQHIRYIGSSFQLKYLEIGCPGITELPDEIGNLKHLQTLDIHNSQIDKLPPTIGRLQNLVRLLVDFKVKLPDEIGNLQALQILSHACSYNSVKFLEQLRRLTNLRVLVIGLHDKNELDHGIGMYQEALGSSITMLGKHGLQSLEIDCNDYSTNTLMDLLCYNAPYLRKLCNRSYISRLPQRIGSLVNLAHLEICATIIEQEDLCILGAIPTLLYVMLSSLEAPSQRLTISRQQFHCLKEFIFRSYGAGGLSMVTEQDAMPQVRRLHLEFRAKETEFTMGFEFNLEHLARLTHIILIIHCDGATKSMVKSAEAAIRRTASTNPRHPTLEIRRESERYMLDEEDDRVMLPEDGMDVGKNIYKNLLAYCTPVQCHCETMTACQ